MKKGLFFSIILISVCILLNNCSKAPKYPDTPQIEFKSMEKYPGGDSIIITINFKDGDGDLGLESDLLSSPYHEYDYDKDGSGNYKEKTGSDPDYNGCNYKIGQYDTDIDSDTVKIIPNLNYNNYIIEILVKQPDNSYTKLDAKDFCPSFYQRFPILNPRENKGPIEGTLSHSIKSLFSGLPGETLKFEIYIIDRALHKSNVIETPEIVMN